MSRFCVRSDSVIFISHQSILLTLPTSFFAFLFSSMYIVLGVQRGGVDRGPPYCSSSPQKPPTSHSWAPTGKQHVILALCAVRALSLSLLPPPSSSSFPFPSYSQCRPFHYLTLPYPLSLSLTLTLPSPLIPLFPSPLTSSDAVSCPKLCHSNPSS
jgi:hypothetical protein